MKQTEFDELRKLIATTEPPHLGPQTRPQAESIPILNQKLDPLLRSLPSETQQAVRSAALLWHDHLDASHTLSQDLASADGSFLHGIMHRREPDYGNAKYWFRRVGQHPAYPELAQRVAAVLKSKAEGELERQLIPRGAWDAFGFVDACEDAVNRPVTDSRHQLLRSIQVAEFEVLLEHICGQARVTK
jgi:hypothetical protein